MPKYSFDHVHLMSPDPVKTAEFYEKNFAAKRVHTRNMAEGRIAVDIDLGGTSILIMQRRGQAELAKRSATDYIGLDHFGITTDNIEATVAALKANGVKFRDEIREAGRPDMKIAFFWAPENVLIELVQVKK